MSAEWRNDPIGQTVALLNLRDSKSRSAVRGSPAPRFGASPTRSLRLRDADADYSPARRSDVTTAIPFSTGTPAEAAAALAFFQALEKQRDDAVARNALLEDALAQFVTMFGDHVSAVEASVGAVSQFYSVTFGPGHIGMILTASAEEGTIEVAELRDDRETGAPQLAKASGKIYVGDQVVAVNDRLLARYGLPTPEQTASEFRNATRPMTVLFKRNAAARLRAAMERE